MGKHSKKRQRTTAQEDASEINPLGHESALNDTNSKDDEEKALEVLVFGSSAVTGVFSNQEMVANDLDVDVGGGLENLMDSDVRIGVKFFFFY